MSNQTPYLTTEEIELLTDRQIPSKQIEWLNKNGWKFAISAAGRPKVARGYHEFKLGTAEQEPKYEQEPDFSHWIKKNGGAPKKQSGTGHGQTVRLRGKAA